MKEQEGSYAIQETHRRRRGGLRLPWAGMALGTMTVNADTDTLTVPETATPSTITLNKADDADTSKSTYTAYRIAAYIDPVANADGAS